MESLNKLYWIIGVCLVIIFLLWRTGEALEAEAMFEEEIRIDRCMNWHGTMPRDVRIGYCKGVL